MKILKLLVIAVCIFVLNIAAKDVAILQVDLSLPVGGERDYSNNFGKRLSQWLLDDGTEYDMILESNVASKNLSQYKVIILPYNSVLPKKQNDAVHDYIDNGGKIVVFYSDDLTLARKMKLNLTGYVADKTAQKWQSMQFKEEFKGFPKIVHQNSKNLKAVYPKSGSKTVAYWHDINGNKSKVPAVVMSPNGFWVSHVLLNGGSSNNVEQRQLFKGMLINCGVGSLDKLFRSEVQAVLDKYPMPSNSAIKKLFSSSQSKSMIASLKKNRQLVEKSLQSGDMEVAKSQLIAYTNGIYKLYSSIYSPNSFEFRGIWDHFAVGLYPGDWKITAKALADARFTDVFINAVWPTKCHYKSIVYPLSDTYKVHGDQIEKALNACKPYGIKVHVWKVCWRFDDNESKLKGKFALQKDYKGNTLNWLCPSVKDNVEWELGQIQEIVSNYDVDGIHLDYIRYNNANVCFCNNCRKAFEKVNGITVKNWPDDVYKGKLENAYKKYRADVISDFVSKVSKQVKSMRPSVKVSAAVYGAFPSCYSSIGQNWPEWVKNGSLDFVVPMNYFNSVEELDKYITKQKTFVNGSKLFSGIGVTSGHSNLSSVETIEQLELLKSKDIKGYVLFDLNKRVEQEVFPLLK
ncbi:MAG: family 10 glycosylhydrolase [Kiritimatiellae bacterium]|jgi:uncharacterized lipoprotein YddW (UPF0748 family)|nr:family 10 glycosylhydrolase [Kiritimatiellia bacterium]